MTVSEVPVCTALNTVLDTCDDVADYERHADRIAEILVQQDGYANHCHVTARLFCGPEHHGARLWVSPAMSELCTAAAKTLPEKLAAESIALHPDDLPWPSGTVVFETPLFAVPEEFIDPDYPDEGPIDVMQWVTHTDPDGTVGVIVIFWQSRSQSEPPSAMLPSYWPRAASPIPFGDLVPVDRDHNFYVLLSLWTLLRDRIALTETRKAPRPSVKRWRRKHGQEPGDIVIVTLRRPTGQKGDDAPGGGVEWAHQWIVDGHWRNQAYGVGHSQRRLQWIAPYIKGPEDAPLVVKDKVYAWTR